MGPGVVGVLVGTSVGDGVGSSESQQSGLTIVRRNPGSPIHLCLEATFFLNEPSCLSPTGTPRIGFLNDPFKFAAT